MLIGKLATEKDEEGKNAATILLKHAIRLALDQRAAIGCAFLIAHAYARPEVVAWYERKFFKRIVKDTAGRETVPMYFELGL